MGGDECGVGVTAPIKQETNHMKMSSIPALLLTAMAVLGSSANAAIIAHNYFTCANRSLHGN